MSAERKSEAKGRLPLRLNCEKRWNGIGMEWPEYGLHLLVGGGALDRHQPFP